MSPCLKLNKSVNLCKYYYIALPYSLRKNCDVLHCNAHSSIPCTWGNENYIFFGIDEKIYKWRHETTFSLEQTKRYIDKWRRETTIFFWSRLKHKWRACEDKTHRQPQTLGKNSLTSDFVLLIYFLSTRCKQRHCVIPRCMCFSLNNHKMFPFSMGTFPPVEKSSESRYMWNSFRLEVVQMRLFNSQIVHWCFGFKQCGPWRSGIRF